MPGTPLSQLTALHRPIAGFRGEERSQLTALHRPIAGFRGEERRGREEEG